MWFQTVPTSELEFYELNQTQGHHQLFSKQYLLAVARCKIMISRSPLIEMSPRPPWLKRQLQAFPAMLTSYHPSCNNVATVSAMSKPAALLIMYPALLISSASVTLLAQFLKEEHFLLGNGGRYGMLTWENQDLAVYKSY